MNELKCHSAVNLKIGDKFYIFVTTIILLKKGQVMSLTYLNFWLLVKTWKIGVYWTHIPPGL